MEPPFKDEIDFHDLVRRPHHLFGYTYVYVLVVLAAVGILYAQRLTDMGKASVVPLQIADSTALVQDIALQAPKDVPPVDLAAVAAPTQQLLDRGKELFQANCSSCHGVTGMGDGPSAAAMNPKPRNFRTVTGWTNGPKVSQMYKTLQEGIVQNGMASYSYIPPLERFALIHYVRSFIPSPPVETLQDLQPLETTYQLSRGVRVAGTLPVRVAAGKLLDETAPVRSRAERMAEVLRSRAADPLVAAAVRDPYRVSTAMLAAGGRALSLPAADFAVQVVNDPRALGLHPEVARMSSAELVRLQRTLLAAAGANQE